MVQTHDIFKDMGSYVEEEKRTEEKLQDPLKAFVEGVNELRDIWKGRPKK